MQLFRRSSGIKVGDWNQTDYTPGVWRVFRMESGFIDARLPAGSPETKSAKTLVFAHRIVGSTWKKSFKDDCFELSLVHHLPAEEADRLSDLLREDLSLAEALKTYVPTSIDLVGNISYGRIEGGTAALRAEAERLIGTDIVAGLSFSDILARMAISPVEALRGKNPRTASLQIVSPEHLRRRDEWIYTSFNVLDF